MPGLSFFVSRKGAGEKNKRGCLVRMNHSQSLNQSKSQFRQMWRKFRNHPAKMRDMEMNGLIDWTD